MNVETAARLMNASISEMTREETLRGEVAGFAVDSRAVEPGQIFFAGSEEDYRRHRFTGAKFEDSHRFIPQAFERGAAAVVARRERFEMYEELRSFADRLLFVDDTIGALQTLAQRVLKAWAQPIIGITGSAGKTTTRNLTAHVLTSAGRRVLQSQKNYNNELGLPLAILQMESAGNSPSDYDVAVLEMGMSTPGEMKRLCEIVQPDIAVELLISPVHLEFFGTVERIAEGKAELVKALDERGTAVLNADDERIARMRELHQGRTITFGIEREADVTAFEIEDTQLELVRFKLRTPLGEARVELPLPGRHNLMNALAAAAIATCFNVAPDKIATALATAAPSAMRGEILHFKNGFTVVDDSYNSNPRSLVSMVQALAAGGRAERVKRRIVIAGEMLELGPEAGAMHRDTGREIGRAGVDFLWGVRGHAHEFLQGAREAGMSDERMQFFEDSEAAGSALIEWAQAGDLILVKGSRGVKTDRVVKMLSERFETDDEVRNNG
ncbi:MAG: UDP-N-acetylmuramoyl-tripeptide--D-alanyl-D-alanine ligase [Pyrinomonadaceae bacterium]|nr:UDP-N-acetylmuramoyl-tripeptide--D-alanyl-D-alanine ligase [Pyrinomonadaceae bacterium]